MHVLTAAMAAWAALDLTQDAESLRMQVKLHLPVVQPESMKTQVSSKPWDSNGKSQTLNS